MLARILGLVWGIFWSLFGILSALGEELDAVGTLVHISFPGLIFLATVIAAWRHEKIGGTMLIFEGIVVAIVYPLVFRGVSGSTIQFVLLTMALPPMISGALFIMDWMKFRILTH
jgi:hypothetical protein